MGSITTPGDGWRKPLTESINNNGPAKTITYDPAAKTTPPALPASTPGASGTVYSGANGTTYSGSTSWNKTAASAPAKCYHSGNTPVYERGDVRIFCSNAIGLNEAKYDMVLDLANVAEEMPSAFVSGSDEFEKLNKWVMWPEVVKLDWRDYGIPPVGIGFWLDLWDLLHGDVVIACQGGHGRTGTCLAALLVAEGYDGESAIDYVRDYHCDKAIETLSQETYIIKLGKAMEKLEGYSPKSYGKADPVGEPEGPEQEDEDGKFETVTCDIDSDEDYDAFIEGAKKKAQAKAKAVAKAKRYDDEIPF